MRIGEVTEVRSLLEYRFQQTEDSKKVAFGTFVKVEHEDYTVLGVIADIEIRNPSLGTYPRPKRLDADVRHVFPDLFDQFPTFVSVACLGYWTKESGWIQDIPLYPPQVYKDVVVALDTDVEAFCRPGSEVVLDFVLLLKEIDLGPLGNRLIYRILVVLETLLGFSPGELLKVTQFE